MEKETHDFMNVDSFSELPFLRPSPPVKEKGIRLFGKQFSSGDGAGESESVEMNGRGESSTGTKENENGECNRKFECHYCCRNFPTSQALGGHQNAHKRERQQAKRAHLQSAIVHGGYPEAHVYGIMNYNRFGSAPSPAVMPYHSSSSSSSSSWNSSYNDNNNNNRFYGSHGFYNSQRPQPIIGSPLALWRVPSAHNPSGYSYDRAMNPPPLFSNEASLNNASSSSSSQNQYLYESKASHVKDHIDPVKFSFSTAADSRWRINLGKLRED